MSIKQIGDKWYIEKDPDASLVYGFDLLDLGYMDSSDSIVALNVTGTNCTIDSSTYGGGKVLARVSGGTAGQAASARFRWTLASGDIDDRTINFLMAER